MSTSEHSSSNRAGARALLVEHLKAGVLGTRWPNGGLLDGITSRTAGMISEHLADGPLQLRVDPPNPHDAEEQLRPYIRDVFEAEEDYDNAEHWAGALITAQKAALDKAFELLGVHW